MNWVELLLSATALVLAAAAFRRASSSDPRKESREAAILQGFQDLRTTLESLPGRIADETAASPLREAVEGVRESVNRLGESLGEHLHEQSQAQRVGQAAVEQGLERLQGGLQAVASQVESGAKATVASVNTASGNLQGAATFLASEVANVSSESTQINKGIVGLCAEVASVGKAMGSLLAETSKIPPALAQSSADVVQAVASSVATNAELLTKSLSEPLPQVEDPDRGLVASRLSELVDGLQQVVEGQRESRREAQASAQSQERGLQAQILSLEAMRSDLGALRLLEGLSGSAKSAADSLESKLQEWIEQAKLSDESSQARSIQQAELASGERKEIVEAVSLLALGLEALGRDMPVRIAQESAARPAPHPELEELAMAVRESGHLRGDVGRQVADAVGRVGQQLSESGQRAEESRERAGGALDAALASLQQLAGDLRASLSPLSDALTGHGQLVAPLATALGAAKDRLEESSCSLRANQVEFSASVELFTQSAQELQSGLALFAREGEKEGAEDPRAAQKALLEALERLLGGFADSLKAHLSESDLRMRETLTELTTRLPAPQA